ncbi:hypothetical protein INS49_004766 [Diaporthe citri]|uniref:uncharacterized protein n=1 Tax=Diaporthe citri TaxID=83186 RepID=UPI001C80175B|nr:uncharacterized protein INS49_004766 [Diaporthe citri]KAG6354162.1 hypothetical protein INS49_004766 [Diaporthe citri]
MAEGDIRPLTEPEINSFLDDLDHNKDGFIDYTEVEQKLDAVYDELVQGKPQAHHRLHRHHEHNTKQDQDRHAFLRSIIGSDVQKIPRSDFAARVREWGVPSMEQDSEADACQKAYMRSLGVWRRLRSYWAVHGPEIAFLCLVVSLQTAFGVWQCVKYATTPQYQAAFGWGVVLAKTCAGALYPTFFFVILSMSRYFSTFMRKWYHVSRFINWDLGQSFHVKMSCVALALATLHAIGHLTGSFNWGSRQSNEDEVAALLGPDAVPRPYVRYVRSLPGWTGIVALGLFYLLALLSMPVVRKWNYEVFQLGHLLMFPIIGLMMAHGTAALLQWPMFGYWLAFPTLLVLVERVTRIAVGFHRIPATLTVLDSETVEVKATIPSERLWKYQAGQYVFLQVPELGNFQWHPFTVSICVGKEMRLHIKTDGNWTGRLRKLATSSESGKAEIEIGINGPFGAPAQRFYDFSHTIVVGAGIGVTPFSGILADLQARDDAAHGHPGHADAHKNEKEALSNAAQADAKPVAPPPPHHQADSSQTTLAAEKPKFADDYRRVDFHWMVRDRNHLLWLSDLSARTSPPTSTDGSSRCTARPNHPESPLTGLINPSLFGRPDFTSILDSHYEEMLKYKAVLNERDPRRWSDEEFKVGVFFCGTPVVGEMLADRCRLLSARGRNDSSKIEYHFMMEVFG